MGKSSSRVGDCSQTASGRQAWPLDMREEDVFIDDIAHHLALQNRFGGATREPYSVAQHSVLVSWIVPEEDQRDGLGHDMHEAYFPDVIRPIKRSPGIGPAYTTVEEPLARCVRRRFGLRDVEPQSVLDADRVVVLLAEARDLMTPPPVPWRETGELRAHPGRIRAWGWRKSRRLFLARFYELFPAERSPQRSFWDSITTTELRFERWRFLRRRS